MSILESSKKQHSKSCSNFVYGFLFKTQAFKKIEKKMVEQFFNYYRIIEGGRNIVIRWMDEFGVYKTLREKEWKLRKFSS